MKKKWSRLAVWSVIAAVGANVWAGGSGVSASAPSAGGSAKHLAVVSKVTTAENYGLYAESIRELIRQGVLHGYVGGLLKPEQNVTRAELAKLIVLAFQLDQDDGATGSFQDVNPKAWYRSYIAAMSKLGFMAGDHGMFKPQAYVTHAELTQTIAKVLQRDVLSVQHWMGGSYKSDQYATRGETGRLLLSAQHAIRSETASITRIRSLNKVTMEVTFDRPLTLEDESLETATRNFSFDHDLAIVNQPRLKTGSYSTYILPTRTQTAGTTYTLSYKGKQTVAVAGSGELIRTNEARQIDGDSFEIEILKSDGVTDYGYVISAYSTGRGSNAFVLDENNAHNGQSFQIVSSLRSRSVTITPEGGEPMTAAYLPFTQSTDGKQEPKFRLPNGVKFKPGVKYTVTSDWMTIRNPSFIAQESVPLTIGSVTQNDASTLNVTLTQDPGDEIFVLREFGLTDAAGTTVKAQYNLQSRKGATGVFTLLNGAKLNPGETYKVQPIGDWAVTANELSLTAR